MSYANLSQLDKDWLRDAISEKESHLKNVSGALASEVISDLFVLASGGLTVAFAVASRSLIPLAANPMPMVQLSLAYITIKSLIDQRKKISNDLNVLNAILQIDEETPENITAMVHDYIEIHASPDTEAHPSHLEVKRLSPEALKVIQKNFRQKEAKTNAFEKASQAAGFLKNEFGNAARMVGKTIVQPIALAKSVFGAAKDIHRIYKNWDDINEARSNKTLRETYNTMLRQAQKSSETKEMPQKLGNYFAEERKKQLYYLHQQQASLRTVSKLRIETAQGFGACAGIIGLAFFTAATAPSAIVLAGAAYTVLASLPSLKVLGDELRDLTKTTDKYAPRVNKAAADFMMNMPSRQ